MSKIRQEQIDFTGLSFDDYATKSELSDASGILNSKIDTTSGNFSNYATTSSVNSISGVLDSKISSASGTLDSKIGSVSGVLNDKINSASGYLESLIPTIPTIPSGINDLIDVDTTGVASGNYFAYNGANWVPTTPAGGVTDHGLLTGLDDDDHSYIYYNKTIVNTMSGYLKDYTDISTSTLSGYLAPKINISGGLGGVTITTPASGQILAYNGSLWVNQNAPTGGGALSSIFLSNTGGSGQGLGTSWGTAVAFNVHRINDPSNVFTHSTSTDTGAITCNSTGVYSVTAVVNGAAGDEYPYYSFFVGGTRDTMTWTESQFQNGKRHNMMLTAILNVTAGQNIELKGWSGGGGLTVYNVQLSIIKIG